MTDGERISAMIELIAKLTERVRKLEALARREQIELEANASATLNPSAMHAITETVAIWAGLTVKDLIGPEVSQRYSRPRQAAWARCHKAGYSLPTIGSYFGGRHHTTVLQGIRRHEELMAKRNTKSETPAK